MGNVLASRESVRALVESRRFRIFIFVVILSNAITIGLQTSPNALTSYIPEVFDSICLAIYIVEALLKLYAYRLDYFKSGWNIFDFSIIALSLFASGILPIPVQFVRVIRLIRVTRMLKVVSLFDQMHVIIEAIGKSLTGVVWASLLLAIVIYIFDVIGVSVFGQEYPEYFGNLGLGAISLFEITLDGWPDIAHDISAAHPTAYVYFISYVICSALIILNVIVGIIVDAIQSSASADRAETSRGLAPVKVSDHVLVLGFNPVALTILSEIVEANRNQHAMQHVVVLDNGNKDEIEEIIKEKVGSLYDLGHTKIHVRSGAIYDIEALQRCNIASSKAVVVNAESDTEAVKAVMACTYAMESSGEECNAYIVATVQNARYAAPIKVAGRDGKSRDRLEFISMQNILARIMVNASRQPGLSAVFTELFNFAGNEFYIIDNDPSFSVLYGKSIAEINRYLPRAIAVGVEREGLSIIKDPHTVVFEQGDSLILVEEDDDALVVLEQPHTVIDYGAVQNSAVAPMRALMLGNYDIAQDIFEEYKLYLMPGSEVTICATAIDAISPVLQQVKQELEAHDISLAVKQADIHNKEALYRIMAETDPHCVLVLGDVDTPNPEAEDNRLIELILYLRDYREQAEHGFGIVSQINLEDNRELIDVTGADDYIVSRHFAALLMAQISQKRGLFGLIESVLSSEGYEVYIKKATDYVLPGEEMDLFSVGAAVAKQGEIFIGLRQKQGGRYWDPIVNPLKFDEITGQVKTYCFNEDDYFVVLAEDAS